MTLALETFAREPAEATIDLQQSVIETPLGPMRLIASATHLRVCDFVDRKMLDAAVVRACGVRAIQDRQVSGHAVLDAARAELADYFAGRLRAFTVPVELPEGDFSRRAWDALRGIPFGATRSYAQQAAAIGSPSAVRAVANANGRNFLAIIVPCHRVIGSNGTLTGYGGGLDRKRWLLDHERRIAGGGLLDA
ncbi:MAG TPA: methylated-DNA--[protein]-cysteine S-methyltransferase [Tepidisphaeraceae bacterium]|jgi:AraC family transcriptional regulator of adaptative response/methylated-DNA-[protein]-cysteine methyltransferase